MWSKLKESFLMFIANLCFKQIQELMQQEHEEHMQEIIDFINSRMEAGLEVNLLAHPDFLEAKFALHSEPLPEECHLTVVEEDE